MAKNNDGLEPGQHVDFETMMRVERNRKTSPPAGKQPQTKGRYKNHKGGGYFDVYEVGGALVAENLRKPEAEAMINGTNA